MKRVICLGLIVVLFTFSFNKIQAQQASSEANSVEKVLEKINFTSSFPYVIEDMKLFERFFLENAIAISQLPEEKMAANRKNFKELTFKSQQQKKELLDNIKLHKKINFFDYDFDISENQNNTYVIDENLGYILVIFSWKRIIQDYNLYQSSNK